MVAKILATKFGFVPDCSWCQENHMLNLQLIQSYNHKHIKSD